MISEFPLLDGSARNFTLQLGDKKLDFYIKWNDVMQVWTMDITDNATQVTLITGVPLVGGVDVLQPYVLGIGQIRLADVSGHMMDPTLDNLGIDVKIYWLSADEVVP